MIYKSFKIKNFKGIDGVVVDLVNSRIVTLVGLNESGKTSIMEGVHLFYQMIKGENLTTEQLNELRPKGIAFTGTVEISATLLLENGDKKKIEKYWKETLNKRNTLEFPTEFTYDYKFIFDLHTYKETKRTCTFLTKTKNSKRTLSETDNTNWKNLIAYIRSDIVPEILYYDDFIFQILEKALDEKITNRWGDLFGKNKINFKEIKLDPEYTDGKLYLSFKIRTESKKEFLVKERSKGFKWFFSFLLFTEFRKKRTSNIL